MREIAIIRNDKLKIKIRNNLPATGRPITNKELQNTAGSGHPNLNYYSYKSSVINN